VVLWLGVKLAYLHVAMPLRNQERQPRAKGEALAALVPGEKTLYLFGFKDEGILFYFARSARRLADPLHLPSDSELVYCILTGREWDHWPWRDATEVVEHLKDEQGALIVLVRVRRVPNHARSSSFVGRIFNPSGEGWTD